MKVIIQVFRQKIIHEILHRGAAFCHRKAAQLGLGLGFEHRLYHTYGDGRGNALPDIGTFIILLIEIPDPLDEGLPECLLMCSTLGGILSVDKTEDVIRIIIIMCKCDLDIFPLYVNNWITHFVFIGPALQEVEQAVFRHVFFTVEIDHQSRIQVTIVPELVVHIFMEEVEVLENGFIRYKSDQGAVRFIRFRLFVFFSQDALGKLGRLFFPFPKSGDFEIAAQRIHRLGTYPIQSYRLLEGFTIVFGAGIDLADNIDYLAQGDPPAKVPDRDGFLVDIDLHLFAITHRMLVDTVVDDLLDQDINTVIRATAIPQFSDIHTGAETDMLLPVKGPDTIFIIVEQISFFCHSRVPMCTGEGLFRKIAHPRRTV